MDVDIVIYAALAVVLLARLWFVFGRRNDSDPQRPNPFVTPAATPEAKNDQKAIAADVGNIVSASDPLSLKPRQIAPASLIGRLEQIKAILPAFDEKAFLQNARTTFTLVVEDFSKGDLSRTERLLGPKVLPRFQAAIENRRKAGQTMETRVTRIRDAETTAASVEGSCASITVRFVSEQMNILRDSAGHITGGAEGVSEEITDSWTFSRDADAPSVDWLLTETHS